MAFNPSVKRKIVKDKFGKFLPCSMCGRTYPYPDAVHIIDELEWKEVKKQDSQTNGIPLCPNCHRVFDENLRPRLYKALDKLGCKKLPVCWKKSNKISE